MASCSAPSVPSAASASRAGGSEGFFQRQKEEAKIQSRRYRGTEKVRERERKGRAEKGRVQKERA